MQESNLLMYTTEDGLTKIEATFVNDTVWLSIEQMAELFQRDRSVIGKHILLRNILFDAIICIIQQIKSGRSRASLCSA